MGKSESSVGMMERADNCGRRRLGCVECGLLVLLTLLLMGAIVTLGVFYSIGEQGHPAPLPFPEPILAQGSACLREEPVL